MKQKRPVFVNNEVIQNFNCTVNGILKTKTLDLLTRETQRIYVLFALNFEIL